MAKQENNKKLSDEDIRKLSFEQAIDKLTDIVSDIEDGQVPLEQSLSQYENGMAMIKHCRGLLGQAQKRIEKLAENEADE
jgi:exodeoxyribonuclease VII small subunit